MNKRAFVLIFFLLSYGHATKVITDSVHIKASTRSGGGQLQVDSSVYFNHAPTSTNIDSVVVTDSGSKKLRKIGTSDFPFPDTVNFAHRADTSDTARAAWHADTASYSYKTADHRHTIDSVTDLQIELDAKLDKVALNDSLYNGYGVTDTNITAGKNIEATDTVIAGSVLEASGTQLMRFKYGGTGYNVAGAPVLLRYNDTKAIGHGFPHGSFLIQFTARDNGGEELNEIWYFSLQAMYNGTWKYKSHHLAGSNRVAVYETTKTTTAFEMEWVLSDDGSGFDDGVEITVMELSAGFNGIHYGTFTTDVYANLNGITPLPQGGNGQAVFGGTDDHTFNGNIVADGNLECDTAKCVLGGLEDSLTNIKDTIAKYKDHANLNNLNSSNYSHLTATNKTDLTDAGNTSLHYHSADRSRTNHTDEQAISTVTNLQAELDAKQDTTYRTNGVSYGLLMRGDGFSENLYTSSYLSMPNADFLGNVLYIGDIFKFRAGVGALGATRAYTEYSFAGFPTYYSLKYSDSSLVWSYTDSTGASNPNPWDDDTVAMTLDKNGLTVKTLTRTTDTSWSPNCTLYHGSDTLATATNMRVIRKDSLIYITVPAFGTVTIPNGDSLMSIRAGGLPATAGSYASENNIAAYVVSSKELLFANSFGTYISVLQYGTYPSAGDVKFIKFQLIYYDTSF